MHIQKVNTMTNQKLSSMISTATEKRNNTTGKRDGGQSKCDDNCETYPTQLYELVKRKQWMETIQRCADHSQEASMYIFAKVNENDN